MKQSSRPAHQESGATSRHERLEVEATEMSLALVKSEIQAVSPAVSRHRIDKYQLVSIVIHGRY